MAKWPIFELRVAELGQYRGRPWFRPQDIQRQKSAHVLGGQVRRAVGTPNSHSHDDRQFVLPLNDDRLDQQRVATGRGFQLIDGVFQARSGVGVANEKTPVLDPEIIVENGLGRSVYLGDKSVLVEGDRGQAHRIECGG